MDGFKHIYPYQVGIASAVRDAARLRKAQAILARAAPNWRAVKRAHRLIRDANAASRRARQEQLRAMGRQFQEGMTSFIAAMQGSSSAFDNLTTRIGRIPLLSPGYELHVVAVKGPARVGKTAALEAAARDLDPYSIRPIQIGRSIDKLSPEELADAAEQASPLLEHEARRRRQLIDFAVTNALRGTGSCRHGVWLFGDSCATCEREDRDEARRNDPKRSD